MGNWDFQYEPVCLPDELADPFYEDDAQTQSADQTVNRDSTDEIPNVIMQS